MDISISKFSKENSNKHPKRFLKEFDAYVSYKRVPKEERMMAIENCFYEKTAKWFNRIKDAAQQENDFKELFLKHFFSENIQQNIFI